eukprot:CAMPEP_0175139360 /NCGR_PEP_ID=MMETSP0087-20121206/10857_1 /TAXON_ID=136419 /ORGANISM="Unknown Unknown, Strain D1" /LENGTH=208 /DNA_ID=CAMNT_0016422357 /DNA_START=127 /DNA_END=753 /DNA_ORIENTATION=+
MGNALFGEKKTIKDVIKEQKRMINRSIRQLEREKMGMKREEQKLTMEIKKAAKANQMKSVGIMAKDLVRMQKHQEKFTGLIANLRAVNLQMTSMSSTTVMTEAMKKCTRSMMIMNKRMNMPQLQQIMKEFEKQSEMLGMKEEMFGDAIEDAMDDEEDEEETEKIVSQVLDEIGISFNEGLVDAPGKKAEQETKVNNVDTALEDRFNQL